MKTISVTSTKCFRMIPVMLLIIAALCAGAGAAYGETFGYTTAGGTAGAYSIEATIAGAQYELTEDATTLDSITVYLANTGITRSIRGAVYRASDSAVVCTTSSTAHTVANGTGWTSMALLGSVSATADNYQLVTWCVSAGGLVTGFSDASPGSQRELTDILAYSSAWPAVENWDSDPGASTRSVYVTYTPVGGAVTPVRRQRIIKGGVGLVRESQKTFAGAYLEIEN